MSKVEIKKMPLPPYGFQRIQVKEDWAIVLDGDVFGRYPTKKRALADCKKYKLLG